MSPGLRGRAIRLTAVVAVLLPACTELSGSSLPVTRGSPATSPSPSRSPGLGGNVSNNEGTGTPKPVTSGSPGTTATASPGNTNPTPIATPTPGPTAEPQVLSLKVEPNELTSTTVKSPCEATISVPVRDVGATPLFSSQVQLKAIGMLLNGDPLTNLTWSSSDEDVATVSAGLVTAEASAGVATITVTSQEKHYATGQPATASCRVNVTAVGSAEFSVD